MRVPGAPPTRWAPCQDRLWCASVACCRLQGDVLSTIAQAASSGGGRLQGCAGVQPGVERTQHGGSRPQPRAASVSGVSSSTYNFQSQAAYADEAAGLSVCSTSAVCSLAAVAKGALLLTSGWRCIGDSAGRRQQCNVAGMQTARLLTSISVTLTALPSERLLDCVRHAGGSCWASISTHAEAHGRHDAAGATSGNDRALQSIMPACS